MTLRTLLHLPALLLVAACAAPDSSTDDVGDPGLLATVAPQSVHDRAVAFLARPEHTEPRVTVRHLLVSFRGAGVPGVTRTQEEAEQLAGELLARAEAGEAFADLVAQHSDDSPEGVYTMVLEGSGSPPESYPRRGMVPAFGDAGWRLQPGELEVVEFDPEKSPYGWHLVMRLE